MSADKDEKTVSSKAARRRRDRAAEVANTFEWLITAFVLAFVFRAFVMEAFRIPTGSMADTLKGAHFRLRCPQCGYRYDHGFPTRNDDLIPPGNIPLPVTRCPNCSYYWPHSYPTAAAKMPVANGDRILVLKCIYQFIQPKRWDIIVFKNPLDPTENYIKRLIGLPGEKVEIIDGDIYINDRISRKPPKVQDELWTVVYDNDYQPVRPREGSFNGHPWRQPFKNESGSKWIVGDKANPTLFCLDSPADQIHTLVYKTSNDKDFKATYAYNEVDVRREEQLPFCSDLMVR
ncbi:MAG: signal peptidase I, partial [Sedimentisphaerales bacterium]